MKTKHIPTIIIVLLIINVTRLNAQLQTNPESDYMNNYIVGGMEYVIIQQEVGDFEKWKSYYDANETVRKQYGMREMSILRNCKNPNKITAIFEYNTLGKVIEYISNPTMVEDLKNAGVIGLPTISFFKADNSGIPVNNYYFLVQERVKDYAVWKKCFDEQKQEWQKNNINLVAVGNDVYGMGNIIVLVNASDSASFTGFLKSIDQKEQLYESGENSTPLLSTLTRYR